MRNLFKVLSLSTLMIFNVLLLRSPQVAQAGCGCDKPPPAPAPVIPQAAFSGMKITLFSPHFLPGQHWTVQFHSGPITKTTSATVKQKRNITTQDLKLPIPQLVVTVPSYLPLGPTRIEAFTSTASLIVPEENFTVIGQPLEIKEGSGAFKVKNHKMAVSADGRLYFAVEGMDKVCKAISFGATFTDYPIQFGVGDIVIRNHQGYLIDLLDDYAADHFEALAGGSGTSNELYYFRHSFEQFCYDHQKGHKKEVDFLDNNWHKNGTPHTDYSILIFEIASHLPGGQAPTPGQVISDLHVVKQLGSKTQKWEEEKKEKRRGKKDDDDD